MIPRGVTQAHILVDHKERNPLPLMSNGKSNFRGEKKHHRGSLCISYCVALNDKGGDCWTYCHSCVVIDVNIHNKQRNKVKLRRVSKCRDRLKQFVIIVDHDRINNVPMIKY